MQRVKRLGKLSANTYHPVENRLLQATDTVSVVANVPTNVIRFRVPIRTSWILDKDPNLVLKLIDPDGVELDENAQIILAGKRPSDLMPIEIGRINYDAFKNTTVAQQRSSEYISQLFVPTDDITTFDEQDELVLQIYTDSAFTVDWSKSTIFVEVTEIDL